ncbi:MAG TPA: polysaccharide biosynthesis protein, partial [Sulfurovum sp.]|nr:polysaccharide biosynthesis protein [Sulfurovum sp.]
LSIEDLLARHPKDLDKKVIEKFVKGKSILITGAGGSIGSEIALQCALFNASHLTLLDHSEYNLYQIGEKIPKANLKLLNITNKSLLEEIFEQVKPDIVIHAAAYKHVPVCENNQETAVYNNVLGSKIVMDVSILYGVQKVVIISTDKAVRPTNVMGATKRVTELYAQNVESKKTEIVAVRFGNVLGSSGSVIPKFKAQIEAGGPLTVTHSEITRYFMLIPEACQLVLQTASIAKGGELFILDMGDPIKIVDLAKQMIRLYGKEDEISIEFTGLRPGEKLFEELLLDESEQKTKYSSIFIANPTSYDITQLNHDIDVLLGVKDKVRALQEIVPEFTREDLI